MNKLNHTIKNILNNLQKVDFFDKIDLHLHSNASDGQLSPKELINSAREKGLQLFSICDHNTMKGYESINTADYPELITGVEYDCWYNGIFFHLLGYGIDVKSTELTPFSAKNKADTEVDCIRIFARRNVKKLISAIHSAGGIAVLAHPACCWAFSLESFVLSLKNIGLDGIETYYPYKRHRGIIKFHTAAAVERIADKLNLIKTGGSDTHGKLT